MSGATVHAEGLCPAPRLCGTCDHASPSAEQVESCRAWLREWASPGKTINTRLSSYGLKHDVERASRRLGVVYEMIDRQGRAWSSERVYVSNGALIAAALLEGYRLQPTEPGSPNAHFNITVRRMAL